MSDLASTLMPGSHVTDATADLPRHLYGTRAALFYLLREPDAPSTFLPPAPEPMAKLSLVPTSTARVAAVSPEPVPANRSVFRDILQSDSFDFRSLSDRT